MVTASDVMNETLRETMKKHRTLSDTHAQLVFLTHRINELNVLIGDDTNPLHPNRSERDYLVPLHRLTLESYKELEAELETLGTLTNTAFEVQKEETDKTARILAGEEPLTNKEKFTLGVVLVALTGCAMTASYFVGGYLGYVFGL